VVHSLGTDKVVAIRYGAWSSDPYYQNNPENVTRTGYYGIGTSTPQALVDGGNHMIGSGQIPAMVGTHVSNRLQISSPYKINLTGDIGSAGIDVTVQVLDSPPSAPNSLRVAVIEKSYDWPSSPGTNGQTHYEGCLLDLVPNPAGTPVTVSTIGDSQTFSFTYNATQVNFHPSFHLTIIAFVQNDVTKEVLQAGYFDGTVGLNAAKSAALIESSGSANLQGFISNDFSNSANVLLSIKGQIPTGWSVNVNSPEGTLPVNGAPQNIGVAGLDSFYFDISASPEGNGGAALITAKMMLPSDTSISETQQFSIVTKDVDVLVVDRDNGENYESYIINALNQTTYSFGVLPINSGDLTANDLDGISAIIWNCGLTEPVLTSNDINAVGFYLDMGGNLYLNGADIAYQLADPTSPYYSQYTRQFFENYLHAGYVKKDFTTLNVDGISGDPVTDDIKGMKIFGGTGANNLGTISGKWPNEILPGDSTANSIFSFFFAPNNIAGIRANHYSGKVVFTAFGFESIAEHSNRTKFAQRIMDWFNDVTSIGDDNRRHIISELKLYQNYPNPFNPETNIKFALPAGLENQKVKLVIYNQIGQKVRTLLDDIKPTGQYENTWNGEDDRGNPVASGVYYYQIKYGGHQQVRKMILMR